MQEYFYALADAITALLHGNELYTCNFRGEDSDFVRFNKSAIRQAGSVAQRFLSLDLISGARHATGEISLTGEPAMTTVNASPTCWLDSVSNCPIFLKTRTCSTPQKCTPVRSQAPIVCQTHTCHERHLRSRRRARSRGFLCCRGHLCRFCQCLWATQLVCQYSFNCDWSFYHQEDKAVKAAYAGFTWDPAAFAHKVEAAAAQLDILRHPPRTIPPGLYRVYLAPAALYDVSAHLELGWFWSQRPPYQANHLIENGGRRRLRLHPTVTLQENTRDGVAPNFQEAGFIKARYHTPDSCRALRGVPGLTTFCQRIRCGNQWRLSAGIPAIP